jgi:hypothetical protein
LPHSYHHFGWVEYGIVFVSNLVAFLLILKWCPIDRNLSHGSGHPVRRFSLTVIAITHILFHQLFEKRPFIVLQLVSIFLISIMIIVRQGSFLLLVIESMDLQFPSFAPIVNRRNIIQKVSGVTFSCCSLVMRLTFWIG